MRRWCSVFLAFFLLLGGGLFLTARALGELGGKKVELFAFKPRSYSVGLFGRAWEGGKLLEEARERLARGLGRGLRGV